MRNYYDVVVNFDDIMYYFYEWEVNDELDYIKYIPLVKVKKKVFKNILLNKIKLNDSLKEEILHKTGFVNGTTTSALIISDGLNSIVLEFNDDLEEIAISTLAIDIELDINELCYCMKNFDLDYECLELRKFNTVGRKDAYVKKYIELELDELYSTNNMSKLYYLYKELFSVCADDFESAYKRMKEHISDKFSKEHYYLYDLMVLSHKKSGLSN